MASRMMACLAIAALAGAVSCAEAPVAPEAIPSLTVVPATDSVLLTYICGNMFRVRNLAFEPREVRWNIHNASPADTGSLRLRGRDVGATHVDYFVTARTRGTMRLLVGGVLRQTKANGNRAACAAPVDTTVVPPSSRSFELRLDAEPTAYDSAGEGFKRTIVAVVFRDGVTATQIREAQRSINAQIVRNRGLVYFRIFDSSDATARRQVLETLRAFSFVEAADFVPWIASVRPAAVRYPTDASGGRRTDYLSRANSVWAASALRLPQAWGCETGSYGGMLARIAVVEALVPADPISDVANSLANAVSRFAGWRPSTGPGTGASRSAYNSDHSSAVASILAAEGDNATGMAGVIWRSDLRLYSLETTDSLGPAIGYFEQEIVPALVSAVPRVLSLSTDFRLGVGKSLGERIIRERIAYTAVLDLMSSLPELLIVSSSGNGSFTGALDAEPQDSIELLKRALLSAKTDAARPHLKDQIVLVGATRQGGARATFSNHFDGLIDLYAPGEDVRGLVRTGTPVDTLSGTSFATPMVAGIAGQLLTMDPTLSASEVKALLLAGARDSVERSDGVNVAPSPVSGISDVVYEADAYGSLRLLSAHAGTPLCGAQFVPWADPAQVDQQIYRIGTRAIRYGGQVSDLFPEFTASSQSLAPGGRVLAFAPFFERQLQNRTWGPSVTLTNGERRVFGERDTLSYRLVSGPTDTVGAEPGELRLRLSRGARTWNLKSALNLTNPTQFGQPSLSPDGRRVLVPLIDRISLTGRLHIAVLDTGTTTALLPETPGAGAHGLFAWSPDSRRVVYFLYGSAPPEGHHIRPVIVTFGSGAPVVTGLSIEPHRFPLMVRWSDEGHRLSYLDVRLDFTGFSDCRRRDFAVSSTTLTLIHTTSLDLQTFCASEVDPDNPDSDYAKTIFGDANSGGPGGGSGGGDDGGGGGGVSLSIKRQDLAANRALLLRSRLRATTPRSGRVRR